MVEITYAWIINPNDSIAQKVSNISQMLIVRFGDTQILPPGTILLIYSPGTDVYNIGLSKINSQGQQPKKYMI